VSDASRIYEARKVAVIVGDGNLFRAVVASGLTPYIICRKSNDVLRHSRYYRGGATAADPVTAPERFIDDLCQVGARFTHQPLLFTTRDRVLLLMSRHREALQKWFLFSMPPHEMVESLVDKSGFALLAREYGLPVPETLRSSEIEDSPDALKSLPPPFVLKPDSRHYGWRGSALIKQRRQGPVKVLHAASQVECERLLPQMRRISSSFVVQRCIPGDDRHVYSFHSYCDRESRPLVYFVGRKIRSFPRDSGISTFLELVKDARVVDAGMQVLEKLRFVGPVKLDFKEDPRDRRLYLLEVNARCTLWNYLGAVNGASIPRAAWADLNGERFARQNDYGVAIKWLQFGNDLRSFLRSYRRDGVLSVRQYLASLMGPKIYDTFCWTDPMPALFRLQNNLKRSVQGEAH
jgi:D-aspartate ligase